MFPFVKALIWQIYSFFAVSLLIFFTSHQYVKKKKIVEEIIEKCVFGRVLSSIQS